MPSGDPVIAGACGHVRPMAASVDRQLSHDLEVSGDTACEVGEAKLKLAAGQTVAVKYLVV
jgi:hypothetical protein